ncbi:MAG: N-acetylneuraminate synthase family protein [Phycisphaeraceae bacterium]|nr:N-acetylneuraminate synthase family protein [Phycisphaeraceae bacterium]
MKTLCVILGRAGSKGLPGKNVAMLAGRPLVAHTIEQAKASRRVDRVVVSTDGAEIAAAARAAGAEVVMRPAELATDTATVDGAARHAVEEVERRHGARCDAVVILYANVPIRPAGLIDQAVEKLITSGGDSVQSVCPVGKLHPYWMRRLTGAHGDVLDPYQANDVYRRQDLPAVYQLDGGIIAVRRESLFIVEPGQPHAFLGRDRRAVVTAAGSVVDIDDAKDLAVARAMMENPPAAPEAEPSLTIGNRKITRDGGVYVIAELGVNHDGSLKRAMSLARAAKKAGADAIKLQLFDVKMLLSAEAELAGYQQASADDPLTMLESLQLSAEQMRPLRELTRELELGFIVTCFSPGLVGAMRGLDVDAVKVASPDCVNRPLLEAVAPLGKPLLVSVGAAEAEEVAMAAAWLRGLPGGVAMLQCVSSYPTADEDASLAAIRALPSEFVVGYSDHTTSLHTGMLAVAAGAVILEKHLTHNRRAKGPDHAASFDPRQFAQYVQLVRQVEAMRGPAAKRVLPCEADVRRVSRQSVCATRDLPAGHVITEEDVTVKRPGLGVPAAQLGQTIGRCLAKAVATNHLIYEDDLMAE